VSSGDDSDPVTWSPHLTEGNARQARKRVAAKVVYRDERERVLLVDPTYKPHWDLPGGMAEANEPPLQAARREVREELGLDMPDGGLLTIDWVSPHGPWDDTLVFMFDGGVLSPTQIDRLRVLDEELAEFRLCTLEEASQLLRADVWRRLQSAVRALRTGRAPYLEDGHPVSHATEG
jgi:8-oxo-dGTP pyrophosphatase MutT (NUDIX family)